MSQTELLLRRLGAGAKYLGFRYMIFGIELVLQNDELLLMLTKGLYPAIAQRFDATTGSIERNLRTVIDACWQYGDRELFDEIAGRRLADKPTVAEFIDMAVVYLKWPPAAENTALVPVTAFA